MILKPVLGWTGLTIINVWQITWSTFYDRQANRLYLNRLLPLEQQCTYAVVLTKRIKGEEGQSIQSPFPYVNPQSQTSDVSGVEPLLSRYGLATNDVAFAWTFTTGSMTQDIEEVRKGLYGVGVFSQLGEEFPVSGFHPYTRSEMGAVTGVRWMIVLPMTMPCQEAV